MAMSGVELLRLWLGETIPNGGVEEDTLFLDSELDDIVERNGGIANATALAEAWQIKAARLSNLVDTAEGDSRRSLSQMHEQALAQLKALEAGPAGVGTARGTVIHRIVR